jgi:hypothetical protein
MAERNPNRRRTTETFRTKNGGGFAVDGCRGSRQTVLIMNKDPLLTDFLWSTLGVGAVLCMFVGLYFYAGMLPVMAGLVCGSCAMSLQLRKLDRRVKELEAQLPTRQASEAVVR